MPYYTAHAIPYPPCYTRNRVEEGHARTLKITETGKQTQDFHVTHANSRFAVLVVLHLLPSFF